MYRGQGRSIKSYEAVQRFLRYGNCVQARRRLHSNCCYRKTIESQWSAVNPAKPVPRNTPYLVSRPLVMPHPAYQATYMCDAPLTINKECLLTSAGMYRPKYPNHAH